MAKSYYISFDNVSWSEFIPSNEPLITYEREGDEIFLRYKVDKFTINRNVGSFGWVVDADGNIVYDADGNKVSAGNETIFDTIETMFFDSDDFSSLLYFKIQKSGVDKYLFKSSVNESKIDTQNGVFEIKPRTDDDYQDILNQYKNKFQDRAASGLFGHVLDIYYPVFDDGLFVDVDFTTFSDVSNTITWTNTTDGRVYARNTMPDNTTTNNRYKVVITNFSGDLVSMELVNGVGANISNVVDITANGEYIITQDSLIGTAPPYMEISNDGVNPQGGSLTYAIYTPVNKQNIGGTLYDILDTLVNSATYMSLNFDIKSTYLWNDALETDAPPGIDTYITANPTNDYVVEDSAIWNHLLIGRADEWATTRGDMFEVSLEDIMNILKIKLRAWWFIDSDGDFRIEHEKYFRDYGSQLDLTTATYAPYKPETDTKVYTYNKGDIVSIINYDESNAVNEDFIAYPIIYDADTATPNSKDIQTDVTCDLQNVIDNPDSVSGGGLILLQSILSGALYHVDINPGVLTPADYYPNLYLSYAYLFGNYWGYFGEGGTADINDGTTLTLDGVKTFLKQDDINFLYLGELDWYKPVTTTNGTAWIEKMEETESEYLKLNVGYDPYL